MPATLQDERSTRGVARGADGGSPGGFVHPVVEADPPTCPHFKAAVTLLRTHVALPTGEAVHLGASAFCARSDQPPLGPATAGVGGSPGVRVPMGAFSDSGSSSGSGGPDASASSSSPGSPAPAACPHQCFKLSFAMQADGTMSNEIELCHALMQWPYLTEFSLISSVISIFLPSWGHPITSPAATLRLMEFPWFYFNLLVRDSQIFLPLLSPQLRQMEFGWRANTGNVTAERVQLTPQGLQALFYRKAEQARSQRFTSPAFMAGGRRPTAFTALAAQWPRFGGGIGADPKASHSMKWMPGLSFRMSTHEEDDSPRLEDLGVAITLSALRVGSFSGAHSPVAALATACRDARCFRCCLAQRGRRGPTGRCPAVQLSPCRAWPAREAHDMACM